MEALILKTLEDIGSRDTHSGNTRIRDTCSGDTHSGDTHIKDKKTKSKRSTLTRTGDIRPRSNRKASQVARDKIFGQFVQSYKRGTV